METIYRITAYLLGVPHDMMREMKRSQLYANGLKETGANRDVIPDAVRRAAGMTDATGSTYSTNRPPRNSGHRG